MYRKDHEVSKIIHIIVNEKYEIQSANIDNQVASQYLKKLNVSDKLIEKLPAEYGLDDYNIFIDRINIAGKVYYQIIAIPKYPQCKNCRDMLIDTATGLYNKNYLEQIKSGVMICPRRQSFSLILIDIDNLKAVNDEFGHLMGDRVIEIVGQAIKNSIRKEWDLGIRYGGDEFIILLSNQRDNNAKKVISRIRQEINKMAVKEGMNIQISAGVAHSDCLVSLEDMIEMADKDLYIEKKIKKDKKERNGRSQDLLKELEEIRDKLNGKAIQNNKILTSAEILELSQKLDKLIVKYLENKNSI